MTRMRAALSVICLAVLILPQSGLAENLNDDARSFVHSLASKSIQSLTAPNTSRIERIRNFRKLFNNNFAVRGIGKWILGRHWRRASKAEREEYLKLFEDLIVTSYVDRFAEYTGEPLKIIKTTPLDKKTTIVFTEIIQSEANTPVRVNWRVARAGDSFKIVDVVVEGTSMSNTMRSDFGSIIRREGGKISGLLKVLRDKTASLRKGDSASN